MNAVLPQYNVNELIARDLLSAFSFGDEIPRDDLDDIIDRHGGFTSDNEVERNANRYAIKNEVNKIGKDEGLGLNLDHPQFFQIEFHKYGGNLSNGKGVLMLYDRDGWILRAVKKTRSEGRSGNVRLRKFRQRLLDEAVTTGDQNKIQMCRQDLDTQIMMSKMVEVWFEHQEQQVKQVAEFQKLQAQQLKQLGIEDMSDEDDDE